MLRRAAPEDSKRQAREQPGGGNTARRGAARAVLVQCAQHQRRAAGGGARVVRGECLDDAQFAVAETHVPQRFPGREQTGQALSPYVGAVTIFTPSVHVSHPRARPLPSWDRLRRGLRSEHPR